MDQIEQLKTLLPTIPEIVTLKKESENSLCGPCLKCGGTDRLVYRIDTQRFWCRHCHEKPGDIIDFHKWLYGVTTKDLLEQHFPKDKQENQRQSITTQWESILQSTNREPVYRLLLENRKISKVTIDEVFTEGKVRFSKHRGKLSIACAYTELNGNKSIRAVQYLSIDGSAFAYTDDKNKVFLKDSKASDDCFFQAGINIEKAKTIILYESVINALSCADCLPEACALALGGSTYTNKVKVLRPYRDSGKKIICFFDNDSAGRKATQNVAKLLGVKTGSVQWLGNIPEGFDINDLLKLDDRKTIIEMIENSKPIKIVKKPSTSKEKKDWTYHFTDLGNAERLVDLHGQDLRYCFPSKRWLVWDGRRWNNDNIGQLRNFCKNTIKQIYQEALKLDDFEARKALKKFALSCENVGRQRGMSELAQSEDGIPILPEQLDKDIYLINCLNGTVDLRTGELRPHKREDLITKLVQANYNPGAECPAWLDHLNKIMAGNKGLVEFLQRVFGYSLTGDTSERKIFIEWGGGFNGKSITNDTIALVLGNYAVRTPTETLLIKRNDGGIPNDIARLKGARFVYASEVEQGKRLAESLIKDLSGGDKISARFLHQEWFEFYPEFKLFLSTNHKPIIQGTDKAIWDRIRLIPFTVRIPEDERIPKTELFEMFQGEIDGIFSWLVAGCLVWQKEGLGIPEEVMLATDFYRNEMDILSDFIENRCILGENCTVSAKKLYTKYEEWAEDNGEKIITKKMFGMNLNERGIDSYKGNQNVTMRIGIGLQV